MEQYKPFLDSLYNYHIPLATIRMERETGEDVSQKALDVLCTEV
jgi:hypothetical protein